MGKKQENRINEILNILAERKRADVTELSALLQVSLVTIRKDLDYLESRGFIVRKQGFAALNDSDDVSGRLAYHYEEKKKIAAKAAELVSDGDTVMIESGSCCAILATVLAETRKDVIIITNSCFIADYLRQYHNISVVLLGGIYQKESQCLVGPMIAEAGAGFHVTYLFAGTDGYSERMGFTNKDQLRAQAVRDMARSADKVVILTESAKFSTVGTNPLNLRNTELIVITDSLLDSSQKQQIESAGIQVIES